MELSVLSPFEPVAEVGEVETGRHGLMIRGRGRSGLLLPQVATQLGWDAGEFLSATCRKAGLPDQAWADPDVTVVLVNAAAAEAMRRILVEAARRRQAAKRGGGEAPIALDGIDLPATVADDKLLQIHEVLDELGAEVFAGEVLKLLENLAGVHPLRCAFSSRTCAGPGSIKGGTPWRREYQHLSGRGKLCVI